MMVSMIQNTPLVPWIGSPSCESVGFMGGGRQSTGVLSGRGTGCWTGNHLCPMLPYPVDGCT